jgi:uncharacterized protein YqfB (UPF0267 family)
MKSSFTRDELLKWVDATRANMFVGPDVLAPERVWTTDEMNEAWARSANSLLNELERFIEES